MRHPEKALARELQEIRVTFRRLATSFGRLERYLVSKPPLIDPRDAARRNTSLTVQQRAYLKLQAKYMKALLRLPVARQGRVKKLRATKGIRAAILAAERLRS